MIFQLYVLKHHKTEKEESNWSKGNAMRKLFICICMQEFGGQKK